MRLGEVATMKNYSTFPRQPRKGRRVVFGLALAALFSCGFLESEAADGIVFRDVESQTRQFIQWQREIRLDRDQEKIKKAALEDLPAPCCSDKSAYTCCCACNMSRSIWGLSQYMIAKQGADADAVRAKVKEWIAFINPKGFSGKSCYVNRCARPFREDGCGGMRPTQLRF